VEQAYEEIKGATLEVVSARPEAALSDSAFLDGYGDPQDERIEVPWRTLQKITNGIGPGELWYLAARQGNGKTSYLIDIAVDAAFNGHRVCFYSMEMTKRQIQVRAQAAFAYRLGIKVDEHQMLHRTYDEGDYKELLGQIGDKMDQSGGAFNVHVPSMGRVTPGVVASLAGEYDLHLIDYIGLMATDAGDPAVGDWRYAAEISNTLKQIALAKNTSIFSASQVNRDGDTIQNKPPKLKNLAQSDHLGNDGDVVLTMKRYGMGAGIFSVEKNRHGPSLNVFFTEYDPNQGNFSEITVDRANNIKDDTDARDY
jgi:replicative DNA helicase